MVIKQRIQIRQVEHQAIHISTLVTSAIMLALLLWHLVSEVTLACGEDFVVIAEMNLNWFRS